VARVHHRAPHGHTGFTNRAPRSAFQRAGENIEEARTQTRAVSAPRLTRRHPINRNYLHLSTNNAARGSHNPRITPAHILVQAKARRHRNGCFHGHGDAAEGDELHLRIVVGKGLLRLPFPVKVPSTAAPTCCPPRACAQAAAQSFSQDNQLAVKRLPAI
jgi:hypothetical protein